MPTGAFETNAKENFTKSWGYDPSLVELGIKFVTDRGLP